MSAAAAPPPSGAPAGNSSPRGRRLPTGRATAMLVAVCVVTYVLLAFLARQDPSLEAHRLSEDNQWGLYLAAFGAKENKLILEGEIFRLLAPLFLHASFLHLLLNSMALLELGSLLEILMGWGFTVFIFLVSGATGSLASTLMTPANSVGASGAIFGIGGALVAWGILQRRGPAQQLSRAVLKGAASFCFYSVIIGFLIPNVDNYAHVGGFLGGVVSMTVISILIKIRLPPVVLSQILGILSVLVLGWGYFSAVQAGMKHLVRHRGGLEVERLQNQTFRNRLPDWRQKVRQLDLARRGGKVAGVRGSLKQLEDFRREFRSELERHLTTLSGDLNRQLALELVRLLGSPDAPPLEGSSREWGPPLVAYLAECDRRVEAAMQLHEGWMNRVGPTYGAQFSTPGK